MPENIVVLKPKPAIETWPPKAACAALALVFLAGCTSAEVEKRADGGYKVSLNRVWSTVAVEVSTPDGGTLRYTSDPETAAGDRVLDAFIGGRLMASER